ncbi:DUF45 domain-containing protein [Dysgonomonadaceae bacterium zrk40]|nr:DUF45 domain-containing protein [Dysgonomonadaceae bacterium zrk40]
MMMELNDRELGRILVMPNRRAKKIIARRKEDYIRLTVPHDFNPRRIPSLLKELRPRLLRIKPPPPIIFKEEDVIGSLTFEAMLVRDPYQKDMRLSLKEGQLHIFIPLKLDINHEDVQQRIREAIINVLRIEAKRVLPAKTAHFARQHGLTYQSVKIGSSRGRWGSCSTKKDINYSLFLMLLPERLIDYVVLHELAHTVEMNHGDRFWQLLEKMCGGNVKELRTETKKFQSPGYRFLACK